MLKNVIQLEHQVGDKVYHLMCDNDSPLADVKDALCQFMKYVGNIEDQVKAQNAANEAAAAVPVAPEAAPVSDNVVPLEQPKAE